MGYQGFLPRVPWITGSYVPERCPTWYFPRHVHGSRGSYQDFPGLQAHVTLGCVPLGTFWDIPMFHAFYGISRNHMLD